MTSLSEAYGGRGRSEVDPRRVYLGVGSFVAGTLLLVVGLFVAAEVVLRAATVPARRGASAAYSAAWASLSCFSA